jgi:hypothetical protein
LNLGGEGEVPGAINQQPMILLQRFVVGKANSTSVSPQLDQSITGNQPYLFCPNNNFPFPDSTVDEVVTNNVPIGTNSHLGPGYLEEEIKRILKNGGTWTDNGMLQFTK